METNYPWLSVSGFGSHIKSTQTKLIIQKKNGIEEYSLDAVKNLLIVGGHTISSATITQLIKKGAVISFFEPDGNPVGSISPFGYHNDSDIYQAQQTESRHRFAMTIAQSALKSRLVAISRLQEAQSVSLFYEAELDFLHKSLEEMAYLIKLDEIRRLHRMTSDMYYEIMSRNTKPEFGFRRRTLRPQTDPINAMISFGYAMLFGNCCVSLIGARLDPDIGLLHEGKGSLVNDIAESMKSEMIDEAVFRIARESLTSADFELSPDRCMLSDELARNLIKTFHVTINNKKIDEQVSNLSNAIRNSGEFKALY
ncbi:MAG: CRISPR-associated endonuclease Cas1 [Methanomicrobiales archaeon HGW-Methanomicrobiales-1]|jgi:CRISPR-associated endonuclease Cas1|nr:MAG: CRISPR-associated endonuclease Cas1 [Methanomicrobiales archaeon HGW-Methanomicrobiales-1]